MDTCAIAGTSVQSVTLLVCIIASLDCVRRQIRPTIVKFRVLTIPYVALNLAQVATSTDPDYLTHGVLGLVGGGLTLMLLLYMMENFVQVLIGLELDINASTLARIVYVWMFARIAILLIYPTLAIVFAFDLTNRVMFARRIIFSVSMIFFFLPLPFVLLRVCYSLHKHRDHLIRQQSEIASQVQQEQQQQPESAYLRSTQLKRTQWQLVVFAVVMLGLVLYTVYRQATGLAELAPTLDEPWTDVSCSTSIYIIGVLLALFVTRSPHAPLRSSANATGVTRAASLNSKRSSRTSNVRTGSTARSSQRGGSAASPRANGNEIEIPLVLANGAATGAATSDETGGATETVVEINETTDDSVAGKSSSS